MVDLDTVTTDSEQQGKIPKEYWHLGETDEITLRRLIERHHRYTGSQRAKQLLDEWYKARLHFIKVFPKEYRRALGDIAAGKKAAA